MKNNGEGENRICSRKYERISQYVNIHQHSNKWKKPATLMENTDAHSDDVFCRQVAKQIDFRETKISLEKMTTWHDTRQ